MDLRNFFRLLRNHWLLIFVVAMLAVAGSAVLTARMTPRYSSGVTFYVSAQTKAANDPLAAYEGALFSQQEVQSYTDLLTGPMLAQSVIRDLALPMSAAQLSGEISAHLIPQTVLLTATVTDASARRAQAIAQDMGIQFMKLVSSLERPPGKRQQPTVRVTVVAPAELSAHPVSPQPIRNLGIALGLGLLIGIGLAAARRSLDTTIKSVDQVTAATSDKPVLGTIPFEHAARKHPLIEDTLSFGHRAEAFRKIRTNLQFIDVDAPHQVLLFTSPLPEEGKSSTVCNLAMTLAQSGKRVIVVEADLRRPRASGYLGLPRGAGVTNVLIGNADVGDAIQQWGDDLFAVLASGPAAPNPSELVGSHRMAQLLKGLRGSYDVVLVDAPPIIPFADALATGPACDGAVMIIRYGKTRIDHVWRATEALAAVGIPLLGSVLSMAPGRQSRGYGYGYHYGRRYRPVKEAHSRSEVPSGDLSADRSPAALS